MYHTLMNVENQTMKIRHFILGSLVVAAMSFATGCNENPIDNPPGNGNAPNAPTALQAVSLSATSVGLKWTAPVDSGVITYRVSWRASDNSTDSGSTDVAVPSATINNLGTSKGYIFSVRSVRSGVASTAAQITWASAMRHGQTVSLRLYETQSSLGSGLTIDPALGGPKNVSVSASNPNPGAVQLAIYTTGTSSNTFSIGAAYAFDEYRNVNAFDQNTFISDSSYPAQSLDSWYGTSSIDTRIPTNGNVRAFDFPAAQTSGLGQGFYVRTGTAGNYHYARVFIKNVGGNLLQSSSQGRFIEVEISYQQTANLPYAKSAGRYTQGNVVSTTGH